MKQTRRFPMLILAAVMWIGVSLACTNAIPQNQPASRITSTPPSPITVMPASRLGETTEQSGYSLSATKIEYPTSSDNFVTPQPGYKKVSIEIILSNISGEEPLNVLYMYATLVDDNGYVYEASYNYGDNNLDMVDLGVGEKVKGWVNFMIPENAVPAYIKYKIDSETFLMAGLAQ
jgi:hypothetical protein